MANITSTYLVAGGSNSYLAAEFLVREVGKEAAAKVVIAPQVWRADSIDQKTMVGHFRNLVPFAAAASATQAATLNQLSWSPVGTTVSAGLDGFYVLESKVVNSIAPEVLSEVAEQGGTALYRAIDSSLAALFSSLTAGTIGTSGAALTVANVLLGEANLDANFVFGDRYGFVHPQAFYDLKSDMMSKNYGISKVTSDAQGNDNVIISTVTFQKTALVPTINSAADYAGAILTRQALGLVVAQNPQVEILDVPSEHSYSIDCTVAFGTGVIRPKFGCLIQSGTAS